MALLMLVQEIYVTGTRQTLLVILCILGIKPNRKREICELQFFILEEIIEFGAIDKPFQTILLVNFTFVAVVGG